jgi:hypothetical protein
VINGTRSFFKKVNNCWNPGPNVIKLFTAVIYRYSMVIPSFCVIKHSYCSKYHRMAVNNPNKKFYNIGPRGRIYNT